MQVYFEPLSEDFARREVRKVVYLPGWEKFEITLPPGKKKRR